MTNHPYLLHSFFSYFTRKNILLPLTFVLWAMLPTQSIACDQSGFFITSYTHNGDGTFTIVMDIQVAGGGVPNLGSTYGFYWNIDSDILSVSPGSFTSSNGTTLDAVFSGGSIEWGDPTPSGTTPFVDVADMGPAEFFTVTIVVDGQPSEWDGGGQEQNACPGGAGSNQSNYEGEFPCFPPSIQAVPDQFLICAGDPTTLSVIPDIFAETIIWSNGETGESITVMPTETTTYEVTASNNCEEMTLTIFVEVIPYPTIEAIEETLEICEGFPAILEVLPMNELTVLWDTGESGTYQVFAPTEFPSVYTATASNQCGEASVTITVNGIPAPTVDIINDNETICQGDSVELESESANALTIEWVHNNSTEENVFVSPTTTTEYVIVASSNCGADVDTVTVNIAETDTSNIVLTTCEGQTVEYNNIPLSAGTNSAFTFNNIYGCDSIVNVSVTSVPNTTGFLTLEACEGETVPFMGQNLAPGSSTSFTLTSVNSCDSLLTVTVDELSKYNSTLQLSACVGSTANYNGQNLAPGTTTEFTLTALNGCDSLVSVSVNELQQFTSDLTLQTCTGTTATYQGQNLLPGSVTDFTLTALNGCDSVVTVMVEELSIFTTAVELEACTGSNALYNGQLLPPGTVEDFDFQSIQGCDSIVTVTVLEVAAIEEELELEACEGTSATYLAQDIPAGTSQDFTFFTALGCDSIVTVMVNELPNYASPLELQACVGTTVPYNGQDLAPGSVTDFTLTALNGCDSVVTVSVTEVLDVTNTVELEACSGSTALYNGQPLDPGTMTDFTFMSALGCDSTVTVMVEEKETFSSTLNLQSCTGTTITYENVPLPPGTTIDFTLTAMNGCDSVVSVTVEEVETIENELDFETCAGTFINYNGNQLAPGTATDFTFTSSLGCDSIVTVTVEESGLLTGETTLQACTGTTVMYNGQALDPGTETDFNLVNAAGCDSLLTVFVDELETFASPLQLQACSGASVMYNGQDLLAGSVTDITLTALNGCDSIITVTVEEVDILLDNMELEACTGTTVNYNGQDLSIGSMTDFTFISSLGCDSIVTVSVNELHTFESDLQLEACTGTMAMYNGQSLDPGSTTDFTLTALNGCDSVVTVMVEEVTAVAGNLNLEACPGSFADYNGQQLAAGSVTDFNLTSALGCDSVLTVTVFEIAITTGNLTLEACSGTDAIFNGQQLPAGSVTDITLTSAAGCDSILTVTVDELLPSTEALSWQGCESETFNYNGTDIPHDTVMEFTLTSSNGCDSVVTVTTLPPFPAEETEEVIKVCEGESVIIFGQPVSDPGVYSETYSTALGCDSIHRVTLDVASDLIVDFSQDPSINLGESVLLQPLVATNDLLTYSWTPDSTLSCFDCPNPLASPLYTSSYHLTVTNELGCQANASIQLFVRKDRDIYIPNSFSPNGDGTNDIFMIFSQPDQVTNISSFRIFSRWGETIYEYYNFPPNDPTFGWDGKHRAEQLNPAVFVYMVEVEFVDGVKQLYNGEVMLMR